MFVVTCSFLNRFPKVGLVLLFQEPLTQERPSLLHRMSTRRSLKGGRRNKDPMFEMQGKTIKILGGVDSHTF